MAKKRKSRGGRPQATTAEVVPVALAVEEAIPPAPRSSGVHRAEARVDVELHVDLESEHNFYTGLTQNISAGGLFIACTLVRRVGDRLRVKVTMDGHSRPLEADAEVRWLRHPSSALHRNDGPAGMGVRFIELGPDDVEAVNRFIERRESLFFDDEI